MMKVDNSIRVPFNVDVLKKIISKDVNGYIFTKRGYSVTQIISEGVKLSGIGEVLVLAVSILGVENVITVSRQGEIIKDRILTGEYLEVYLENGPHIYSLSPFQKVLVRNSETLNWKISFFSHYDPLYEYPYICLEGSFKKCIPFNEKSKHLVGTNKFV